jgi:hypothetical protein
MIAKIREAAENTFPVSDVNNEYAETEATRIQTSVSAMLPYGSLPEFSRELEFLVDLNVTEPNAAENLYVAEYTFGMNHGVHPDGLSLEVSVDQLLRAFLAFHGYYFRMNPF